MPQLTAQQVAKLMIAVGRLSHSVAQVDTLTGAAQQRALDGAKRWGTELEQLLERLGLPVRDVMARFGVAMGEDWGQPAEQPDRPATHAEVTRKLLEVNQWACRNTVALVTFASVEGHVITLDHAQCPVRPVRPEDDAIARELKAALYPLCEKIAAAKKEEGGEVKILHYKGRWPEDAGPGPGRESN